MTEPRVFIYLV